MGTYSLSDHCAKVMPGNPGQRWQVGKPFHAVQGPTQSKPTVKSRPMLTAFVSVKEREGIASSVFS